MASTVSAELAGKEGGVSRHRHHDRIGCGCHTIHGGRLPASFIAGAVSVAAEHAEMSCEDAWEERAPVAEKKAATNTTSSAAVEHGSPLGLLTVTRHAAVQRRGAR